MKAQEQQRKSAKDQTDAALKAAQLQVERDRITNQRQVEDKRIQVDAVKAAVGNKADRERMMAELSVDVLKHLSTKHTTETTKQPTKGE